jgi:hypothetical protein
MSEERTRVDFNAPESLIRQADAVADLLDTSRTRLLVEALRDELESLTSQETFRRQLREAYYDDRIDLATVRSVLGTEEAMRVRRLRSTLEREPPAPYGGVPDDETFYTEKPSTCTAEETEQNDAEKNP